jgi:sugar lactone lactonase YvrE
MAGRVVAHGLYLPEGLRWREDALWFADRYGGSVCRVGPDGVEVIARLPGRPGGLGWTRDGALLVVAMERRSLMSLAPGGGLSLYADLSAIMPAYANGLLVDPADRAYVGNFGFDHEGGEAPSTTHLLRVDPDGSVHAETPPLMSPSGPILVDDGRTMIVAETYGDRLTAMQVRADGHLDDPRILAEMPEGSGPEGIAEDDNGRIWVSCARTGRAVAVTRSGTVEEQIECAGEGVYCAAVGGPHGRTLFLGIAALDLTRAARTPTGRIEAFDL